MKITHGHSKEVTHLLSAKAAAIFAAWIGSYTVIKNQKTIGNRAAYDAWMASGKDEALRPIANAEAAYLADGLPFLKEVPSQIRRNAGAQWYMAHVAFQNGIRSRPRVRHKHEKRNCYVTNELFVVQAVDDKRCIIQFRQDAKQSSKGSFFFGVEMPFSKAQAANSLYVSRKGRRFWISMSFEQDLDVLSEEQIKQRLSAMTDGDILQVTEGYDVGIANQVMSSRGVRYHYTEQEQDRLAKKEQLRVKYQRKYARVQRANDRAAFKAGACRQRKNGTVDRPATRREKQWLERAGKVDSKIAGIKYNRSHHISKAIADDTPLVAAFEDINLQNLQRKPKAKQCPETGAWLRNGAAAKRGLNKALASVNLGQIRTMVKYKLKDRGKLMVLVRAAYSSQECSHCHHIEPENRESQSEFVCKNCGTVMHADQNAATIQKQRVIGVVRDEAFSRKKSVRKTALRKKGCTAPELASSGCGETVRPSLKASFGDAPKFSERAETLS